MPALAWSQHALFGISVIEDSEEFNHENEMLCKLEDAKYRERKELLQRTKCIIWDENSIHINPYKVFNFI